jgi:hypothetical protein
VSASDAAFRQTQSVARSATSLALSHAVTCNSCYATYPRPVRRHRERLRQHGCGRSRSGFPNAPEFAREAHRQSTLVANSEQDLDDQAFVDAVSSDWDETT